MNNRANYFRLGLFVLTAIVLAVLSIGVTVGPNLFRPQSHLETYFMFSISGLEVGSPVKFRGIPVGEVEEILLSSEAYPSNHQEILSEKNSVAVVRMKINLADEEVKKQLKEYISHGLRVQTQLAGITGSLYLSMEFLDSDKYPADRIKFSWTPKYLYIPSAPSLSNEIVENVKNFLASLDTLDLKGNLEGTLPVLQSLIGNLERIAKGLEPNLFNSLGDSLTQLFVNADHKIDEINVSHLNELIEQIRKSAASLDNLAKRTEAEKLVKNLSSLSQNLNNMIKTNSYDLALTLRNLNAIAENLKNLSSSIPNNPAGLLLSPKQAGNPLSNK